MQRVFFQRENIMILKLNIKCRQFNLQIPIDYFFYIVSSRFFSDHTKVQYFVNVPNVSLYSESDLEELLSAIATILSANYDDIIVSGVRNGCVIVTFMIRKYLIPHLRALYESKERNLFQKMSKHKVFKVMIREEILYKKGICFHSLSTK